MATITMPSIYYNGRQLKTTPDYYSELHEANALLADAGALREQMWTDGYLLVRNLLDRDLVLAARRSILERLEEQGALDPAFPLMDGVIKEGVHFNFRPDLAKDNPAIEAMVYGAQMMRFFDHFLGGPATHFDFTWLRAKAPGPNTATNPHCDIVFMSRGTKQLYTAWAPLGDVSYDLGGLMILEGSHLKSQVLGSYWEVDVDTYCVNGKDSKEHLPWTWHNTGGAFDKDAFKARDTVGGRWLSSEFQAGDVLIFTMYTLHASLDNQTNQVRLSTDTRYQLASELIDPRWIGQDPIAHGEGAKQGLIC
jgi:hypothetical protein